MYDYCLDDATIPEATTRNTNVCKLKSTTAATNQGDKNGFCPQQTLAAPVKNKPKFKKTHTKKRDRYADMQRETALPLEILDGGRTV